MQDLNLRPPGCKPDALTAELTALPKRTLKDLQLLYLSRLSSFFPCVQSQVLCTETA